jgi:hypothetical protein
MWQVTIKALGHRIQSVGHEMFLSVLSRPAIIEVAKIFKAYSSKTLRD